MSVNPEFLHSGVKSMGNASTVSSNMRDATNEAREGVRDMGRTAGAASGDLQKDLQMLRDDFSRLAQQVADIVTNRGNAAWQRARSGVDGVMSDAQDKGQEAVDAIDKSVKNRPYTTLAIAVGLGFLFGSTWRR